MGNDSTAIQPLFNEVEAHYAEFFRMANVGSRNAMLFRCCSQKIRLRHFIRAWVILRSLSFSFVIANQRHFRDQ